MNRQSFNIGIVGERQVDEETLLQAFHHADNLANNNYIICSQTDVKETISNIGMCDSIVLMIDIGCGITAKTKENAFMIRQMGIVNMVICLQMPNALSKMECTVQELKSLINDYEFVSTPICAVELNSMQNSSEIVESILGVLEKEIQSCPVAIRQTSFTTIEDTYSLFKKHIITDGTYRRRGNTKYHIKKLLNCNKHLPTNVYNPNHRIHKTQYSHRT